MWEKFKANLLVWLMNKGCKMLRRKKKSYRGMSETCFK